MVAAAMSYEHGLYLIPVPMKIREIQDYNIDSKHFVLRETWPAIDNDFIFYKQ